MLVLARAPTSSGHACRWRHAETSQTDSATFVQHQLLASFADLPLRRRQKKRSVLVLLKRATARSIAGPASEVLEFLHCLSQMTSWRLTPKSSIPESRELIVIRNSDLWSAVIEAEVSCPPTYRKSPEPLQFDEELVNQGRLMSKTRRQEAHRNIVRRERKCGESGFIKLCKANGILNRLLGFNWQAKNECSVDDHSGLVTGLGESAHFFESNALFYPREDVFIPAFVTNQEQS